MNFTYTKVVQTRLFIKGEFLMPKAKYEDIYKDIKKKIEIGEYSYGTLLPSENQFIKIYNCSRNTVRRALSILISDGYVQSIHGKGVRIIYQNMNHRTAFTVGGIETFKETATRNQLQSITTVKEFSFVVVDEELAKESGFPVGTTLYKIVRIRYLDGKALIHDRNYFLASLLPNLTPKIAEESIYEYLEDTLHIQIATSQRRITVEHATVEDLQYLDLGNYDCLAVITSHTYDSHGFLFEYTQSRHHPEYFCFEDTAVRKS